MSIRINYELCVAGSQLGPSVFAKKLLLLKSFGHHDEEDALSAISHLRTTLGRLNSPIFCGDILLRGLPTTPAQVTSDSYRVIVTLSSTENGTSLESMEPADMPRGTWGGSSARRKRFLHPSSAPGKKPPTDSYSTRFRGQVPPTGAALKAGNYY